jgi:hypothetical protein
VFDVSRIINILPLRVRNQLDSYREMLGLLREIDNPRVLVGLGPSGLRGLLFKRGKQDVPSRFRASHQAHFDWTYPADQPAMAELYARAKQGQWDGATYLPWGTDVDPLNPEVPILPEGFMDVHMLESEGIHLSELEQRKFLYSIAAWMLSQFLHGEQGALMAAAQVTEAVQFFDGKLYGATQVVDEGRHVEVFHRYLDTKLEKLYQINDNLFVLIDALMEDSRWDMKFLGMQIMIEGLALGAFGVLYQTTREPLLKKLLEMVIQDEARHVHYGVLALREYIRHELSEKERQEREDWAFEVALLMRNRFLAYEVYEEWFEGVLSRDTWRRFALATPGLEQFRQVMFSRLMPNLREIGLLGPRMREHYERVGLMKYVGGAAADQLSGAQMLAELDAGSTAAPLRA